MQTPWKRLLERDWAYAVAVILISLAVYLPMLPTDVSFEDSAEFVTASAVAGILHPSGFPLHTIIGWLFARIPIGTIPWRVAAMSSLAAAFALGLAVVTVLRWARQIRLDVNTVTRATVAVVILSMAFTDVWWSQAIYAKNYALHALLFVAMAYCHARSVDDKRPRWGYATGLLLGLSAANHLYLTVAAAPWVIAAWLVAHREWRKPSLRWLGVVGAGLAGLLPYAYIIIRSHGSMVYSTNGYVTSLAGFVPFIGRSQYGDVLMPSAPLMKLVLLAALLIGALTSVGVLAALATVGAWRAIQAKRRDVWPMAVFLLGGIAVVPTIVLIRTAGYSEEMLYVSRVYFLTVQVSVAMAAAVAAIALSTWLAARHGDSARILVAVAFAFVTVVSLVVGRPYATAFTDTSSAARLRAGLASLPPNAVLVVRDAAQANDTTIFTLAYLKLVEKVRPDVIVVSDTTITVFYRPDLDEEYGGLNLPESRHQLLQETLDWDQLDGRPVFATFPGESSGACVKRTDGACYASRSNGFFYEIRPAPGRRSLTQNVPPPDDRNGGFSFALDQILTHEWYVYAAWLHDSGRRDEAISAAATADSFDHSLIKFEQESWRNHIGATATR